MKAKGVRNAEVAKAAGVHEKTVSQWLNDRFPPSEDSLELLATMLGVSKVWLRYGDRIGMEDFLKEESGRTATRVAEATPRSDVLPRSLRRAAAQFELEAIDRGASDAELNMIRGAIHSPAASLVFVHAHDGTPLSEEEQERLFARLLDGLRGWLVERLRGSGKNEEFSPATEYAERFEPEEPAERRRRRPRPPKPA